jgi:predicted acyltransferase
MSDREPDPQPAADAAPAFDSGRRIGVGTLPGRVAPPAPAKRIDAIDLARGIAVALMILSHGVNGLLSFDQFTEAGIALHALTKFSSSLFIIVFGIALGVAFVPHVGSDAWPRKRLKLLLNGLIVLFWYKLLTVVEMNHLYEPEDIVDALLYRTFPSYVEILGFYAIALLWLPFVLPAWARLPVAVRWSSPVVLGLVSWLLLRHFDFWGIEPLQALLVEHPDYYTWGQFARGPLVLLGLLIGGLLLQVAERPWARRALAALLAAAGLLALGMFAILVAPEWPAALRAIAHNAGKHPPELLFMLYSIGGALLLLALALAGGARLAALLRPLTLIGSNALQAFVFHIVVIFVLFRWLLGWFHTVDYGFALTVTLLLIAASAAWIGLLRWIQPRA